MNFTGLILCGGQSSRMGQDKALMMYKGLSMLKTAEQTLSPLCNEILILGDPNVHILQGRKTLEDAIENVGPLGGMLRGLSEMKNDEAFIVSVDTPALSSTMLTLLKDSRADEELTHFKGDRTLPFPGIYSKELCNRIRSLIEQDILKVTALVENSISRAIELPVDSRWRLNNINTPQDYKNLLAYET